MTAAGRFAGAIIAYQFSAESAGMPASAVVITSGSSGERCAAVTASAIALPPVTSGASTATSPNIMSIEPPSRSGTAAPVPR